MAIREVVRGALPFLSEEVEWRFRDAISWSVIHENTVFVDATPQCIGIVRPGCAPVSVPLRQALPIYQAEYVAALAAVYLMSVGGEPFTLFTDNMGVRYNLDKGRCPRVWLPILLEMFSKRNFSVTYVPSNANPADTPSRALWW